MTETRAPYGVDTDDGELLTVREAADILRVSEESVRRQVRAGKLPAVRTTAEGRMRIPRSALTPSRMDRIRLKTAEAIRATTDAGEGELTAEFLRQVADSLEASAGRTEPDRARWERVIKICNDAAFDDDKSAEAKQLCLNQIRELAQRALS